MTSTLGHLDGTPATKRQSRQPSWLGAMLLVCGYCGIVENLSVGGEGIAG